MKVLQGQLMKLKKERIYKLFFISLFTVAFLASSPVLSETFYSDEIKSELYKKEVNNLILLRPDHISERHRFFSAAFLGKPYRSNTLKGNTTNKEVLVINLDAMDCFTYLDYTHSLIKADNYYDFINILKNVRYKDGIVSYKNRNHFFYNWLENVNGIVDVTSQISLDNANVVLKYLNLKANNELYLDGIKVKKAKIYYLKPEFINADNLENFKSGDYIGIYSNKKGLDVSHIGILIVSDGNYIFRHASSIDGIDKVVDMNFIEYIKGKPGIIVYRNKL